jgi:Na+/melibiose symporter-like transporter
MAMGAELSRGYHDRTRVFGVMQVVENAGMALGAIGLFFLEGADDQRSFAGTLSMIVALGVAVLILVMTLRIRERSEFQGRGGATPFSSFRDVFANPHARLLVVIFFAEQLGFSTLIVLLPYLSDYVLETPGNTAIYAGTTLAAMAVSIPVWVRVSRRVGKQPTWLFSVTAKIFVFAWMFTLETGDFAQLLTTVALFGILTGSGAVVGPSLKADVIDWDEARTGERKEGSYFATWNFAQKAAGGIAIWIVGTSLAMTGYEPGVAQGEDTLLGIRWLAAGLPAGLHVVAGALIYRFRLDEAAHRQARAEAGGA